MENISRKRRIAKEIATLHSTRPELSTTSEENLLGTSIRLVFNEDLTNKELPIVFEVLLGTNYPFGAPTVTCCTVFTYPSPSDGRDLLGHILQDWSPQHSVLSISEKLLPLIYEIERVCIEHLDVTSLGTFDLGQPLRLSTWTGKSGMDLFCGLELNKRTSEIIGKIAFVVTHSAILQLELGKYDSIGHLLRWASLKTLTSLKRVKHEEVITFRWDLQGTTHIQRINIPRTNECIALITENMQKNGIIVDKHFPQSSLIKEEEVNAQSLNAIDIKAAENTITALEARPESLTLAEIRVLMENYQKAIEFYSVNNPSEHSNLLQRLHHLLADEQVSALLTKQ